MTEQILASGIAMTALPADNKGDYGAFNLSNVTYWTCNAAQTYMVIHFNDGSVLIPAQSSIAELVVQLRQVE